MDPSFRRQRQKGNGSGWGVWLFTRQLLRQRSTNFGWGLAQSRIRRHFDQLKVRWFGP